MANNYTYIGEELKYAVQLTAQGFSMETDDFEIVASVGTRKVTYKKADLIRSEGTFYVVIDTSKFRKGDLYLTAYAYVPDADMPDGTRVEIDRQKVTTLKAL